MTFFFIVYIPFVVSPLILLAAILRVVHIIAKYLSNNIIRIILAVTGSITMLTGLVMEFIAI